MKQYREILRYVVLRGFLSHQLHNSRTQSQAVTYICKCMQKICRETN